MTDRQEFWITVGLTVALVNIVWAIVLFAVVAFR